MLYDLRKHSKTIIYITAFVFIVGMALMGLSGNLFNKQQYLGKIGKEKIQYKDYYEMFQTSIRNWQQQNQDKDLDEKTIKDLNDQTWNQLVQQRLFEKEIKRLRIKVTDDDVIEKLQNDPPEMIKTAEVFQTEGVFDHAKYMKALTTGEPVNLDFLEGYIRGNLPYEKLYDKIISEVEVDEEEVKTEYVEKNDKADVKIIFFDPKNVENVEVSEDEMKKYYEDNKADYEKEPARKYKYVTLKMEPSPEDKKLVKDQSLEIYNRAVAGEDFAELAKEYSQGPSAPKGGDLGFFTAGKMVKAFNDAAFALKPGEISKPVLTKFGYHIIKSHEKRKNDKGEEEVHVSHILFNLEASQKTKDNHNVKSNELLDLAEEKGLDKAAEELKYSVSETREFFENAQYISGIGREAQLVTFAFNNPVGEMPEPVTNSNGDIIISEVSYKVGKHFDPFEDVKKRIESKIKLDKQVKEVYKVADAFVAKYKSDEYFEKAAKDSIQIVDQKGLTTTRSISKIGKDEEFNKTILALEEGQMTELVKGERGAYIAKVEKRMKPDMAKFEEEKESLVEAAKKRKENTHYNEWYTNLRDNTEIIDNRSLFF